jgi:hypothetical protein
MVRAAVVEFSTEIHYLWLLEGRSRETLLDHGECKWRSRSVAAEDSAQRAVGRGHLDDILVDSDNRLCL